MWAFRVSNFRFRFSGVGGIREGVVEGVEQQRLHVENVLVRGCLHQILQVLHTLAFGAWR